MAKAKGYKVVERNQDLRALNASAGKVIAVNPDLDQWMAIQFSLNNAKDAVTLADYTRKGIELLADKDRGFFMMVEGGKIDWVGHANDAFTMIKDIESFEQAVNVAIDFYNQHPEDTLIIVTGDHETGGLTTGLQVFVTQFARGSPKNSHAKS